MQILEDTGEPCACKADRWEVSATLIGCLGCGRVWARCNGVWVADDQPPTLLWGDE